MANVVVVLPDPRGQGRPLSRVPKGFPVDKDER